MNDEVIPMSTVTYPPKIGFSIREACQASSLGRSTLYRHIAEGRLRVTRVGGRVIVPVEALNALIAGRE